MRREDSGSVGVGAGSSMCVADLASVRRAPMPSLPPHCPSQAAQYAAGDMGMRRAMETVLGVPGTVEQRGWAHQLATLPMRLGGLGLRSASRMAPAAFWASWADALPMLSARLPELTDRFVEGHSTQPRGCLAQLHEATMVLDRSGFVGRPGWHELKAGRHPPVPISSEPGEWQHGWQYHGSSSLEYHFRETVVFVQSCPANQAHLRSHSGPGSSVVFTELQQGWSTGWNRNSFELWFWRGYDFRWTSQNRGVSAVTCWTCLAGTEQHAPHSGRLRMRAGGPERTLGQGVQRGGVRCNTKLRDMNVAVAATDQRAIEVRASGLPINQGAQLAGVLNADGMARGDKERKYASTASDAI